MRCGRWPIACGRARSMNSSARSRCWAPGKPLRQALEKRPAAFADPLGPAGHRQDHARAAHRAPRRRGVHAALGGHGRRQGHPRSRRARAHRARRARAPQRAVPRRSAPLQQGAAGHVPAVRRRRHADLHRRDHRESLVRSHQRVVVARARVRAALARRRRHRQTTAPRARGFRARSGQARTRHRRRSAGRAGAWRRWRCAARARHARGGRGSAPRSSDGRATITLEQVREVATGGRRRFDKGGEQFYDQISALHKAVRGTDPDAALYWFARMLDGGCDPHYLARRIVRMAVEDIGLADPRGQQLALDAWQTFERLGSPEGELALANARGVSRGRAEEQRGLRGLRRSEGRRRAVRHARCAAALPQCADQAHEGSGLRRGLPIRARRAGCVRERRALSARRDAGPPLLSARAARTRDQDRRSAGAAAAKPDEGQVDELAT